MNNSNVSYDSTSSGVQILEEEEDEFYEPTDDEIIEYAEYLGMNIEEDQDLLWIAREGLKCKLPEEWKACKTASGDIFYFNFVSQSSQWEHPLDEEWIHLYAEEKKNKEAKKHERKDKSLPPVFNSNPKDNAKDKMAKSKVNPLNKVKMAESMENMELDSNPLSNDNSKSSSLKKLDTIEGVKSASNADLKEGGSSNHSLKIKEMREKSEEELKQYFENIEAEKKQKLKELQEEMQNQINQKKHEYDSKIQKELETLESQNQNKYSQYKKKKEQELSSKLQEIDQEINNKFSEISTKKQEAEKKIKSEMEGIKVFEESKRMEINRKKKEIEDKYARELEEAKSSAKNSAMRKEFAMSAEFERDQEYENRLNELQSEVKSKSEKVSIVKNELYDTKVQLENYKLEYSKLKDNLAETSNELMIERNKIKLLTSGDYQTDSMQPSDVRPMGTLNHTNKSVYEDELTGLREEVDRLRGQVNKLSFSGDNDNENLQADLQIVSEYKTNVDKEKKKVHKIYQQLLADKENFKKDLADLKYLDKDSEAYYSKRQSLKSVKNMLDSKITSINTCISNISKSEAMLKDFERALERKLGNKADDEINISFNDELYAEDKENGLELEDPEIKQKYSHLQDLHGIRAKAESFKDLDKRMRQQLKSDYSKKFITSIKNGKTGHKDNFTQKYRTAYDAYYNNRMDISDVLNKHRNWCSNVRSDIGNILRERQLNRKYGSTFI